MIFLNRPKPPFKEPVGVVAKYMRLLPASVASWAKKEWVRRANKPDPITGEVDYLSADDWFIEFNRPFMSWTWSFDINMSEDDIQAHAETTARYFIQANELMISVDKQLETANKKHKVQIDEAFPFYFSEEEDQAASIAGVINRLSDVSWWRRHYRKAAGRDLENIIRNMGWVNRRKQIYVSDIAISRRRQQKFRNNALMDTLQFINELGESFLLTELFNSSVANPAIRRAELMVRIAGFEEIAKDLDHVGEFITLTAPSRFHCALERSGQINPKYDGSTPRETQAYLQKVWSRIRTQLNNEGIKVYGFRVAEPHHDGTPHWHGLFFMKKQYALRFRQIVAKHACREDREELGLKYFDTHKEAKLAIKVKFERMKQAREAKGVKISKDLRAELQRAAVAQCPVEAEFWNQANYWTFKNVSARVTSKAIDWNRGSAAGYIAKYIAKNIDGRKENGESAGMDYETDDGRSMVETAERVVAWAAMHGIRQFQQVGGPPVSVWRELRRLRISEYETQDVIELAGYAADKGDWCKFVQVMGGIEIKRNERPLQLYKEDSENLNKYGEPVPALIKGVVDAVTGEVSISRFHEWVVGFGVKGSESSPWTCVNNCTKVQKQHSDSELLTKEEMLEILNRCEPVPVEAIGFKASTYEEALMASGLDPIEHSELIGRVIRNEKQPLTPEQQLEKEYYEYAAQLAKLKQQSKSLLSGKNKGIVQIERVNQQKNAMSYETFGRVMNDLHMNLGNQKINIVLDKERQTTDLYTLANKAKAHVNAMYQRCEPNSDKATFAQMAKDSISEFKYIERGVQAAYNQHMQEMEKHNQAAIAVEHFNQLTRAILNKRTSDVANEYHKYTASVLAKIVTAERVEKKQYVSNKQGHYKYALPTENELLDEANALIQSAKDAFWDEFEIMNGEGLL